MPLNQEGSGSMSAARDTRKMIIAENQDQRAGSIALVLLKFTLLGAAIALVGTLAHIAWKLISA